MPLPRAVSSSSEAADPPLSLEEENWKARQYVLACICAHHTCAGAWVDLFLRLLYGREKTLGLSVVDSS